MEYINIFHETYSENRVETQLSLRKSDFCSRHLTKYRKNMHELYLNDEE